MGCIVLVVYFGMDGVEDLRKENRDESIRHYFGQFS